METNVQTCYRHPDQPAGIVCQRCDRPICPRCMNQASVGFHCPECVKQGKQKVYQGVAALQTRPIVTMVLIGINVAVFVLGAILDGSSAAMSGDRGRLQTDFGLITRLWQEGSRLSPLYKNGSFGVHGIGVGNGQWYRLVTSGFLHYGIIHLALNMYALWILGRAVEHIGGRLRFGVVYGVSLLAGALGALLVTPDSFTAGASGAIYGLMGAIFLAQRAQGIPFRNSPLLGVLILNLAFTFGIPGISIGGHLGGLAGGALSGWLLFDYARRPGLDRRIPLFLCGAAAVSLVAIAVIFASTYTIP